MRTILFLALFASTLFGGEEISALYLSWYGDPTTTATIQWHTPMNHPDDELVLETPDGWITFHATHQLLSAGEIFIHTLNLSDLHPDTDYRFRLGGQIYSFRTLPATLDRPVRFLVGGDAFASTKLFRKMNETAAALDPDFAVIGGDIAYALGTNPLRLRSSSLRRWFTFLSSWKEQMVTPSGRLIPMILVPGNHDISPDNYELFFTLFAFPKKQLYRTFDAGSYLTLFLLDTGHFHPIEGRQTLWLDQTLAARSSIPYRFAIYHEAAYPTWYAYSGLIPKKIRTHWTPLFDKHELPIVFENHNHAYKRTYPLKAGQIAAAGTVYLGDGSWGTEPRKTNDVWYLEKKAKKNCVWLIELNPQNATLKAVDLLGEILDELSIPSPSPSNT
ncbi:MAG: metallophosphoesterase family protein [Verrucomicrobia bacterium]|nr:metallophosphoesterase family protein [Verrucomicrobiota bacterium]